MKTIVINFDDDRTKGTYEIGVQPGNVVAPAKPQLQFAQKGDVWGMVRIESLTPGVENTALLGPNPAYTPTNHYAFGPHEIEYGTIMPATFYFEPVGVRTDKATPDGIILGPPGGGTVTVP